MKKILGICRLEKARPGERKRGNALISLKRWELTQKKGKPQLRDKEQLLLAYAEKRER